MAILNRETDYAIRILRDLLDGKERSVSSICQNQGMTKPFVYKIVKKLERNDFVAIERGKQGGVRLSCNLEDKSLYDLMEAVDNIQYVNDCFKPDHVCEFAGKGCCGVHMQLAEIQRKLDNDLKSYMLDKIIVR